MPIIEVDHVIKEFRLGQLTTLGQSLSNGVNRILGRPVEGRAPFRALDDVAFGVEPGEVLGIIGHNGAGKSTLLKILAGITRPTKGQVAVNGSVAPLIEVGAGLVEDMTGRENVYLNASILGMKRADIKHKFDEIVAFAELEEFIDTPVKRYSSGMQIRLGFSIATAVESEILIVDEVLAVGDIAFQRKCFDRLEQIIHRQGRTILLVSHNIRQVERICSRVLLMDHGRLAADGAPKLICEAFYSRSNEKIAAQARETTASGRNIRISGEVFLESFDLLNKDGNVADSLVSGEPMSIRAAVRSTRVFPKSEIVFGFHTTDFVYIASMGTAHLNDWPDLEIGTNVVECRIPRLPLVPGVYGIRLGIIDRLRRELFYGENLKIFAVQAGEIPTSKMAALGLVHVPATWTMALQAEAAVT